MLRSILSLGAIAALAACAPMPATNSPSVPLGEYVLVGIGGTVVAERNATVILAPGQITGQSPCNSYAVANNAALPEVSLGAIQRTEMACDRAALEAQFFNALAQVNRVEYLDGVLTMKGGPASLILEYGHRDAQ